MSSTGGGVVVHHAETKPLSGNGKTINVTNNSGSDVTFTDDDVNNLTAALPDGAAVTIPSP